MKLLTAKRSSSAKAKQRNVQAVRHWAAMTIARAEELRLVGLEGAASELEHAAESMQPLASLVRRR